MRSKDILLVAALLAAAPLPRTAPLHAQERRPARVWAAFGVGGERTSDWDGTSFLGQLTVQRRPHHFALRVVYLEEGRFPDSGGGGVSEFGLSYGRMSSGRFTHAAVAAGLAGGLFNDCPGKVAGDECLYVGIPLTAEAALNLRVIGLGIQAHLNLNTRAIFGGLIYFIPIGWMP
jgi:hypothetical protein